MFIINKSVCFFYTTNVYFSLPNMDSPSYFLITWYRSNIVSVTTRFAFIPNVFTFRIRTAVCLFAVYSNYNTDVLFDCGNYRFHSCDCFTWVLNKWIVLRGPFFSTNFITSVIFHYSSKFGSYNLSWVWRLLFWHFNRTTSVFFSSACQKHSIHERNRTFLVESEDTN